MTRGFWPLAALILLATLDALLTRWGLALGAVTEANPIMAALYAASPWSAVMACIGVTAAAGAVLWAYRRVPLARWGLRGLLAVRVGVMVLHGVWVAQVFVIAR